MSILFHSDIICEDIQLQKRLWVDQAYSWHTLQNKLFGKTSLIICREDLHSFIHLNILVKTGANHKGKEFT